MSSNQDSSSAWDPVNVSLQTRRNYTLVEVVYIVALSSFGLAFIYGIPVAIQLEYSVLFCVLALAIVNAITFHVTYPFLFGTDDSIDNVLSQEITQPCHACKAESTNDLLSDSAWLWIGCLISTTLFLMVKVNMSNIDYLHPT